MNNTHPAIANAEHNACLQSKFDRNSESSRIFDTYDMLPNALV